MEREDESSALVVHQLSPLVLVNRSIFLFSWRLSQARRKLGGMLQTQWQQSVKYRGLDAAGDRVASTRKSYTLSGSGDELG